MKNKVKFILLILPVFYCFNINAQKKRDILINKVISITETTEDIEDGQKALKTGYTKFDATGEIIEEIDYKNDGKFDKRTTYEYDSKGNKKKEFLYDVKGTLIVTIEYEYDNEGNKSKEIYLTPKGQKEKTVEYKYNNGLKTERLVILPNGKIKTKKKYIYEFQK